MNRSNELAEVLLEKARGDQTVLERLIDHSDVPSWSLGFHAQQAVEKAIKAVLAFNAVEYSRSHDIKRLLQLLTDSNLPLPPEASRLHNLTPFAAALRYEDELGIADKAVLDRTWALRCARQAIAWAENIVSRPA